MDNISRSDQDVAERPRTVDKSRFPIRRRRWGALAVFGVLAAAIAAVGSDLRWQRSRRPALR
jgi:hypothetical protein